MPQGIGGSSVKAAPGNVLAVLGDIGVYITVKIPAKKFKPGPRRGNTLKQLYQINTHPRPSAGGSKGVYANFHIPTIPVFGVKEKGPVQTGSFSQPRGFFRNQKVAGVRRPAGGLKNFWKKAPFRRNLPIKYL
jgi:hypothetical protein